MSESERLRASADTTIEANYPQGNLTKFLTEKLP